MKEKIQKLIQQVLKNLEIQDAGFSIEHPEDFKNGDYSTNVAMVCAKQLKTNPKELAEKIVKEIQTPSASGTSPLAGGENTIEKIEVAGPGFINFYLSREFFTDSVNNILSKGENWGKNNEGNNKKVIVEYSSPNIAKPFTVGHLRSTIIGDSIARILTFSGFNVIRDNHLGDWGTQFGKLIVAIKKWGNLDEIEKSETPIKLLVGLYVKFHDEAEKDVGLEDEARASFAKLEKKDEEAIDIWKRCIEISKKEFDRIYKKLKITSFDTMYGESFFEDKMATVIDDVKGKNIGKESEGAFIVEFEEDKNLSPLLLLKKDGSSLYALRDLAADKWRKKEYGDDIKIINEVGAEQTEYFRQIFETEEMLGYFKKGDRVHIAHGLYRFAEGKMSTRKGNVIWLEDIINEAEKRAGEINKETKEVVAIGALKFNDLKRDSLKDILFNWEEILNIKGDSGTYLQYTAVRANSILNKAKEFDQKPNTKNQTPTETIDLEKYLYQFPEIVEYSYESLQPHHIATYLTKLASEFNTFYGNTQILVEDNKYILYHLDLIKAFTQTMKNGLWLLGIETPEKM
ncbi:MAG: arginine--tRNA ligase [Candidatus Paceibacterota bacterium]|jgi:arginyl-tRNA synthetase